MIYRTTSRLHFIFLIVRYRSCSYSTQISREQNVWFTYSRMTIYFESIDITDWFEVNNVLVRYIYGGRQGFVYFFLSYHWCKQKLYSARNVCREREVPVLNETNKWHFLENGNTVGVQYKGRVSATDNSEVSGIQELPGTSSSPCICNNSGLNGENSILKNSIKFLISVSTIKTYSAKYMSVIGLKSHRIPNGNEIRNNQMPNKPRMIQIFYRRAKSCRASKVIVHLD